MLKIKPLCVSRFISTRCLSAVWASWLWPSWARATGPGVIADRRARSERKHPRGAAGLPAPTARGRRPRRASRPKLFPDATPPVRQRAERKSRRSGENPGYSSCTASSVWGNSHIGRGHGKGRLDSTQVKNRTPIFSSTRRRLKIEPLFLARLDAGVERSPQQEGRVVADRRRLGAPIHF